MTDLVCELEDNLLGIFQTEAARLSAKFPNAKIHVYSHSVGRTDNQGHGLGIDCLLTNTPLEQSDNIALSVSLVNLTTEPKVNADVCWGHSSGYVESSFYDGWSSSDDWPDATKQVLEKLYEGIPQLLEALEVALERGNLA